jgi:4-hydroxy-3-methylbut-2-enyl diphosphate reductase
LVQNEEEARRAAGQLKASGDKRPAVLIAQTTFSEEEFAAIETALRSSFPELEAHNTICPATRDRQNALREMLPRVDAVVVAGGKTSANTRRLLEIALAAGKPALLAEGPDDVTANAAIFSGAKTAGLTAGASTPPAIIDGIAEACARLNT